MTFYDGILWEDEDDDEKTLPWWIIGGQPDEDDPNFGWIDCILEAEDEEAACQS